ncbi:hypothetical protein ACQW02_12890 [Humitalea sp. 24SJ18S-53]|uniref:hypothetical protein n=1 Tax=Humitalea sp. 24SJ18S-53 TaxID=3422307 RepID=UPI003D6715D6
MILATVFLLGAAILLVLARRNLRRARGGGDEVRASDTRLVLKAEPGTETPSLWLERGGVVIFGPVAAAWAPHLDNAQAFGNPEALPGRAGGAVVAGRYHVVAMVDLSAHDAIGSGQTALDERLRNTLGNSAMVLEPVDGGAPPILLHGVFSLGGGSPAGIALQARHFLDMTGRLGNPEGLTVEVIRRRIQRAGWGGERGRRR